MAESGLEPANMALIIAGHISDTTGTNLTRSQKKNVNTLQIYNELTHVTNTNAAILITVGNNWNI